MLKTPCRYPHSLWWEGLVEQVDSNRLEWNRDAAMNGKWWVSGMDTELLVCEERPAAAICLQKFGAPSPAFPPFLFPSCGPPTNSS